MSAEQREVVVCDRNKRRKFRNAITKIKSETYLNTCSDAVNTDYILDLIRNREDHIRYVLYLKPSRKSPGGFILLRQPPNYDHSMTLEILCNDRGAGSTLVKKAIELAQQDPAINRLRLYAVPNRIIYFWKTHKFILSQHSFQEEKNVTKRIKKVIEADQKGKPEKDWYQTFTPENEKYVKFLKYLIEHDYLREVHPQSVLPSLKPFSNDDENGYAMLLNVTSALNPIPDSEPDSDSDSEATISIY